MNEIGLTAHKKALTLTVAVSTNLGVHGWRFDKAYVPETEMKDDWFADYPEVLMHRCCGFGYGINFHHPIFAPNDTNATPPHCFDVEIMAPYWAIMVVTSISSVGLLWFVLRGFLPQAEKLLQ